MIVKKAGDGNYYVFRKTKIHKQRVYRNWFLVRASENKKGELWIGMISLPKELIGKKIMFKVVEG